MLAELVNNDKIPHRDILLNGLVDADEIIICVAFFKLSGLALVKKTLLKAIKNGANVRIIVGLDFFITDPKALWDIFEVCKLSKNAHLMLFLQDNVTFHPKLYYWTKGETASVLIGSSNLTRGGLEGNFELSVLHVLPTKDSFVKQVKLFLKNIENHERYFPATNFSLSQYQRKYEVFT